MPENNQPIDLGPDIRRFVQSVFGEWAEVEEAQAGERGAEDFCALLLNALLERPGAGLHGWYQREHMALHAHALPQPHLALVTTGGTITWRPPS